jgi:hypothetical protein
VIEELAPTTRPLYSRVSDEEQAPLPQWIITDCWAAAAQIIESADATKIAAFLRRCVAALQCRLLCACKNVIAAGVQRPICSVILKQGRLNQPNREFKLPDVRSLVYSSARMDLNIARDLCS